MNKSSVIERQRRPQAIFSRKEDLNNTLIDFDPSFQKT